MQNFVNLLLEKVLNDNAHTTKDKIDILYTFIFPPLDSPLMYFDENSDEYLEEKLPIIVKLYKNEELTRAERLNRKVFEKIPKERSEDNLFI